MLKKLIRFSIFISIFLAALQTNPAYSQRKEIPSKRPALTEIESSLFELANKEREKRNLPPLTFSKELSSLARKHSQEMTARGILSHFSPSGESYTERLVAEGFYFMNHGENVALSDSFLAGFIHQELMESPGHRENIIDPSFEHVGIGVVSMENKKYYITQDFLRVFEPQAEKEVRKQIQEKIDEIRLKDSLSPLLYTEEADEFAGILSTKKANGHPLPGFPGIFGEAHSVFLSTPSLTDMNSVFEQTIHRVYEKAGLGVWIGRNKKYPGGAYFITLILFPENDHENLNAEALTEIVFQEINRIREKNGLSSLCLEEKISEEAKQISFSIMLGRKYSAGILPKPKTMTISYVVEGPYMLPTELQMQIKRAEFKKIGIGIFFGINPKFPSGTFWVTVTLEE